LEVFEVDYSELYPYGSRHKWIQTTHLTGVPEQTAICCPECGQCAIFDEPFVFYTQIKWSASFPHVTATETVKQGEVRIWKVSPGGGYRLEEPAPELQGQPQHQWEHWLVIEKYPTFFHWQLPGNGIYDTYKRGVVKCRHCHFVGKHDLNWPCDAYYRWDIRGTLLWAWSEEHARQLLQFIGGVNRNPEKAAGWMYQLPKQVLTAKVRPLIIKAITQGLAKNSC